MTVTNLPLPPLQQALVPRVKTEIAALWQLAWPILIGQLANVGMAVADVAMAGHASAQDLAGVALGSSVWMIVVVTLMGIMMSVNPTVAHYVGAGQFDRVPHVVRQALWKALGVGVVAMVLANLSGLVFDHMELEPVVRDIAVRFVQITSLGLPAFACYRVLYGYSASLDQTKPIMAISILALVLNCGLNWLLILAIWVFPNWVVWVVPGPPCCVCGSTWGPCCGGCGAHLRTAAPGRLTVSRAPTAKKCKACSSWACP